MDIQAGAIDRVLEDCIQVLSAIRTEHKSDRTPYAVDLRRLLESGLVLRFGEYLQFLEKYGFLKLDRRSDVLSLTRPGRELIEGKLSRSESLRGDASYHFGDRLNEVSVASLAPAEISTPIDGRYLLHHEIGAGAMSTVSTGIQLSLNQPVAIKRFEGLSTLFSGGITPSLRRELRQTIETNANIESHFTLSILDMNVDAEVPYVISELCAGGNLRRLMDVQTLKSDVALALFHQIVLGLNAAHEAGVVHGDLKPENILLTQAGNVKISDLGFTRLAQTDTSSQQRAYVGYASLGYLAPEMFRQDRTYTVGSDIYAMGIILYELLAGRLPGRRSPLPSQIVDGLPEGIDDLFDGMADDDHEARIDSLAEVIKRLEDILGRDDMLNRAEIFLSAPFELPEQNEFKPKVLPVQDGVQPEPNETDLDDKQTQNVGDVLHASLNEVESRGLETINSSSLEEDLPVEPVEDLPVDPVEDEVQVDEGDAEAEALSGFEGTDDASIVEQPKVEPLPSVEPSLTLDRREKTEVVGPDNTSMLDSIIEE